MVKVVSQLEIITKTLHILEQRVSMNEESVSSVMEYFKEVKHSAKNGSNLVMQFNHEAYQREKAAQQLAEETLSRPHFERSE